MTLGGRGGKGKPPPNNKRCESHLNGPKGRFGVASKLNKDSPPYISQMTISHLMA